MATKTITITGHTALLRALGELTDKARKQVERKAARAAAKPVAAKARQHAPRLTGDLAASIKIKALRRSRMAPGRVGVRVVTSEHDSLFAGQQFYGAFQEYGTAYIEPRPYMSRARDEMRTEAQRIFHREIKRAIADAASSVRPRKTVAASKQALAAAGART